MIKDIKEGLGLLKHISAFKIQVGVALFLFALNLFYMILFGDDLFMPGFNMAIALNFIRLTIHSGVFYEMIGTSPKRRVYEEYLPNAILIFSSVASFILITVLTSVRYEGIVSDVSAGYSSFILGVVFGILFLTLMFKHLISAIIVFIIGQVFSSVEILCELTLFSASSLFILYIKGFVLLLATTIIALILGKIFKKHSYVSIFEKVDAFS